MRTFGLEDKTIRRGVCVASAALLLAGIPAVAGVTGGSAVAAGATLTVQTPGGGTMLGYFVRKDDQWYAGVRGMASSLPTATVTNRNLPPAPPAPPAPPVPPVTDPAAPTTPSVTPTPTPTPAPAPTLPPAAYSPPAGVFPAGAANAYAAPVDLTPYLGANPPYTGAALTPDPTIEVTDGSSTKTITPHLYEQVVTAVRARKATVSGTSNVTITVTATDQFGQPVVGVPLRLAGSAAGGPRVNQLAVSDAQGQVTFTGPGVGAGDGGGYPTGGYTAYADLNVNDNRGPQEPGYEVIQGTVSFVAPGHSLYHSDKKIKNAGGVYGDAAKGSRAAKAKGFDWIDQDGQLAFSSKGQKLAGAGRISSADDLVWVNAHGSPFNPKWLKKGRFETKTWTAIKKHKGIRDAEKTLRQDAALGLSVEWEVKDVKPFNKAATLDAAFTNLARLAQQYYGPGWASRVEIKVLSNLKGGQKYALKVLKHAHSHGFTTMYLARGKATGVQIPAASQPYVTYIRGAAGDVYPTIPSPTQDTPVRQVTPHL